MTTTTTARLPDDLVYPDTGCPDLGIPACVRCPLSLCRFDMPAGRAKAELTMLRLRALLAAGLSVAEAAAALGVSQRTVYRARSRDRLPAAQSATVAAETARVAPAGVGPRD